MLFSVQNSNNEKWQYKILPARILRAKRWQQSLLHRKKIHLQLNTRGARANNKTSVDTRYLYLRRASYVDCETNKKTPHKISRNSLFRYFRLIFNLCLIICWAALRTAITAPRKKKSYPDDPKQQSTNKKKVTLRFNGIFAEIVVIPRKLVDAREMHRTNLIFQWKWI